MGQSDSFYSRGNIMNVIRLLALNIVLFSLMACGGSSESISNDKVEVVGEQGGEDNNLPESEPTNLSIKSSMESATINESNSIKVPLFLIYTGEKNLSFKGSHEDIIEAVYGNNEVTLNVRELHKTYPPINYEISVTDGDVTSEVFITIQINNVSFDNLYTSISDELIVAQSQRPYLEINNLVRFYADLSYRSGLVSKSKSNKLRSLAVKNIEEAHLIFGEQLESFRAELDRLNQTFGSSDDQLEAINKRYVERLNNYADELFSTVSTFALHDDGFMPELKTTTPIKTGNTFSFFIGVLDYGYYDNETGDWHFKDQYAFLNSIASNLLQCNLVNKEAE